MNVNDLVAKKARDRAPTGVGADGAIVDASVAFTKSGKLTKRAQRAAAAATAARAAA